MDSTEPEVPAASPELSSWLLACLAEKRDEYEQQFAEASSEEARQLDAALDALAERADQFVTTGVIPDTLVESLQPFMPGSTISEKLKNLVAYEVVHHRLEFDVATDVCERLDGADRRVLLVTLLSTHLLLGYAPTSTVIKYFNRAARLYLAGYEPETVILCGAVLEAALAERFPNEVLSDAGIKPAFKRADEFSVGQRMAYEEKHPVLDEKLRQRMRDLNSWRIDAIHVQIDIASKGADALGNLALLLPVILPTRSEKS